MYEGDKIFSDDEIESADITPFNCQENHTNTNLQVLYDFLMYCTINSTLSYTLLF